MSWLFDKLLWLLEKIVGSFFDLLDWLISGLPSWSFPVQGIFQSVADLVRGIDVLFPVTDFLTAFGVYMGAYVLYHGLRPFLKVILGSRSPL